MTLQTGPHSSHLQRTWLNSELVCKGIPASPPHFLPAPPFQSWEEPATVLSAFPRYGNTFCVISSRGKDFGYAKQPMPFHTALVSRHSPLYWDKIGHIITNSNLMTTSNWCFCCNYCMPGRGLHTGERMVDNINNLAPFSYGLPPTAEGTQ